MPAMLPSVAPPPPGGVPFGHDDLGVDGLPAAGYRETELLLSGTAADDPFTTRVLLRHPADPADFRGAVLVEPMHWAGGRSVWRAVRRHLVRGGYAWAEVAAQATAPRWLSRYDARRYADVSIVDGAPGSGPTEARIGSDAPAERTARSVRQESDAFRERWIRSNAQAPEILAQAAAAIRAGLTPIPGESRVFLGGLSQTGGITRAFAATHHARLSDTRPVFDGYLAMASGGDALPDLDVPVIELMGESELDEVRQAFLLPGQARGLTHRRADAACFRLYEVAGMGHTDSRDDPAPDVALPTGQEWSRFPHAHAVHFAWNALVRWTVEGIAPPPGRVIDTDAHGIVVRDALGHARGGLRSPHLDVPLARVTAVAGPGPEWLCGAEAPLHRDTREQLYGTEDAYRRKVGACLAELVAEGYYLPDDATDYLSRAGWTD